MIWLTQRGPVKGRLHSATILGLPLLSVWSVTTMTFVLSGFDTRLKKKVSSANLECACYWTYSIAEEMHTVSDVRCLRGCT
jgi:hypothetical protein